MTKALPEDFSAILDLQPVGPSSLRVKGEVEVNSGGWSGKLTKNFPQGTNELILILDLQMTPPSGDVIQVISRVPVSYAEKPAQHEYTGVMIRQGSKTFTIDVQVVR